MAAWRRKIVFYGFLSVLFGFNMESVRFLLGEKEVYFEADRATCKLLLKDDVYTIDYITRCILSAQLVKFGVFPEDNGKVDIIRLEDQPFAQAALEEIDQCKSSNNNNNENNSNSDEESICVIEEPDTRVWVPHKKTPRDNEATLLLLKIRGQEDYITKFGDKKHQKTTLWSQVADEMRKAGYNVGEKKEGAEKCRQKFCNLQRAYVAFSDNAKSTGASFMEKPPFYEEMHNILGYKDKVNPPLLVDSLSDNPIISQSFQDQATPGPSNRPDSMNQTHTQSETLNMENPAAPTNINATNSFFSKKKVVKPLKTKNEMIETIKECHSSQLTLLQDITNTIKSNMTQQTEFFKNQTEQRSTLIAILQKLCEKPDKKSRKRRRKSDSSSSD